MADETTVPNSETEVVTTPVAETEEVVTPDENTVEETAAADTLKPHAGSGGAGDSKAEKIADLIGLMSNMDNQWLDNLKDEMSAVGNETSVMPADADGAHNRATIKAKSSEAMGKVTKEDLEKLFAQDENLSEDFRNNATTLFQGAVAMRVAAETAELEEQYEGRLTEAKEALVGQFAERLDTYLDYVADKYVTENKIAIENGIRAELSESFIQGIRKVFEDHYVTIPDEKIDVLEGYESQIADLEEQLHNATVLNIELTQVVESREKKTAIDALAEGMTLSDREKLENILEDVDYNDLEDFNKKAGLIKENYFGEGTVSEAETGLVLNETEDAATAAELATKVAVTEDKKDPMSRYVAAIKRDIKDGK